MCKRSLNARRTGVWHLGFTVQGFAVEFIQAGGGDAVAEVKVGGSLGCHAQVVVGQTAPEKRVGPIGQLLSAAFPKNGACRSNEAGPFEEACTGNNLVHALRTFSFDRLGHLPVELGGCCAGTGAEGEDVGVGEAHLCDEAQTLFKVGFGFAGKSDDYVGRDDQIGDGCAGVGYELAKAGHSAAAGHTAQLGVGAGLEGQVQMWTQASGPAPPQVKEAFGQLPRFQTAEAEAGDVGFGEEGGGQFLEIGPLGTRKVPAECPPRWTPVSTASR